MSAFKPSEFIKELDSYFAREDVSGAANYLIKCRKECEESGDDLSLLTVLNELVGFYRQTGQRKKALECIDKCFEIIKIAPLDDKTAGTLYLNCATTMKRFEMSEDAMQYYDKAKRLLTAALPEDDPLIAGLYNNTALALKDLGRFKEAEESYLEAIKITEKDEKNALENAISLVNLAQLYYDVDFSDERVSPLLDKAIKILSSDKYVTYDKYAFTCRNTATAYGYFGRFADEKLLNERADKYYGRA